jgi:O-antigen/teichoic acid export membrane protein
MTYGRHLTYLNFLGPILGQADNIILGHFWGVGQLAVYSLARVIPDKIGPFIKQIIGVGLPKLAQKTASDIEKVFYKRLLQTALLGAIAAAGYILLAPVVFKYLMPKYLDSVFYSQLLAITFIFTASIGYIGTAMTAQKMVRPLVLGGISASVIKILLYVILGIWGGILGLVLAQLIYYIIVTFINIVLWKFIR